MEPSRPAWRAAQRCSAYTCSGGVTFSVFFLKPGTRPFSHRRHRAERGRRAWNRPRSVRRVARDGGLAAETRPNGLNKLPSCRVDLLGSDRELYASVIMGFVLHGYA